MSRYIQVKYADLMNHTEPYVMHQVNCIMCKPHGLSDTMFAKYPHANLYQRSGERITKKEFVEYFEERGFKHHKNKLLGLVLD